MFVLCDNSLAVILPLVLSKVSMDAILKPQAFANRHMQYNMAQSLNLPVQ